MAWREGYASWLADKLVTCAVDSRLPMRILGYTFKPETNLTVGSPALLVFNILKAKGCDVKKIDSHVSTDGRPTHELPVACYLIGCKHAGYEYVEFPKGSVVIDPFRYIKDQEGVKVIRIGE